MEITYKSICDKLGFAPGTYPYKFPDHEDDSKPSPYAVLSKEELDFLIDHRVKNGSFACDDPK